MTKAAELLARTHMGHVSVALLAIALAVAGAVAGAGAPLEALNAGIFCTGAVLCTFALLRFRDASKQNRILLTAVNWMVAAAGFVLVGLFTSLLTVLGFGSMLLAPVSCAVAGAGWTVFRWWRSSPERRARPHHRRDFDVALLSMSLGVLVFGIAAATMFDTATVLGAGILLMGGCVSSTLCAAAIMRKLLDPLPLSKRVLELGTGLATLVLHGALALAPAISVIWLAQGVR